MVAHPGVHSVLEVLYGAAVVEVGVSNHLIPQTAIAGQEGSQVVFSPGERHQQLISSVGCRTGGMTGWWRGWESECCQVWRVEVMNLVHDAQSRNVPTLLEGLELSNYVLMVSALHQPLCSSLDTI